MQLRTPVALATLVLAGLLSSPVLATDYDYFKSQSCAELGKELVDLQKAEKAVNDAIQKKESKANVQAVATAILVGWPFWGSTDHGDAHNQLAEIRTDLKYVVRAQKAKKCK